jgi:hypothetical protein
VGVRRLLATSTLIVLAGLWLGGVASASFPYLPSGGDPHDPSTWRAPSGTVPSDLGDDDWKFASTPEPGNPYNTVPGELGGVRGAHVADAQAGVDTAWATTTGRDDVAVAVLDSGIRWDDRGAMLDLRLKTRLNTRELPRPRHDRAAPLEGSFDCASFRDAYDANADGVVNVLDYACDARVQRDPAARGGLGVGPADLLDPQDVLIAFSNGTDQDANGFVDDIVGWDFLDDDNDPYDDVAYGHGTGQARGTAGEADNGGEVGTCPNCMVVHMRVGDSFVADVNRFAQAVIYAADNRVLVVQEALGTLNNSTLARQAIDYAYNHGVVTIASWADEAAQHHNYPAVLPHTIVVNSLRKYQEGLTSAPRSYLQLNGCTNFGARVTISIPSTRCSSEATSRAAGMAGLVYSAALNAREAKSLRAHPTCRKTDGTPCAISANEVRQVLASGALDGTGAADDVNFAFQPELSCTPVPAPGCTDPNLNAPGNHVVLSPLADSRRYPARKGHDAFYGYGRVNAARATEWTATANLPPEAEIDSPDWFDRIDPARATVAIRGRVGAARAPGGRYRCQLLVGPGAQPNNGRNSDTPPGDFAPVAGGFCDGTTERSQPFDGTLGAVDISALKSRFPATAGDFRGREPGVGEQTSNGRPNSEPYAFTVKVVVTAVGTTVSLAGEDRRQFYLHRDRDLLEGFPIELGADGASPPVLEDLDGDNRNELILGTSDGVVHAYRRDGTEPPGWPVRGDRLPLHAAGRAFRVGAADRDTAGAILASVAVGDLNRDGSPDVVAADLEGKLYVWNAAGERTLTREAEIRFSGKPLTPFVDVRKGKRHRTQHGFLGSPVLADIDRNDEGRLEILIAGMDRHLYAFNHGGSAVRGFPVLVVDPSKVAAVDPVTHAVTFKPVAEIGEAYNQGAIIDTPAVGDLTGDGRPEIVLGTNEEYPANAPDEGGFNAGNFNTTSVQVLAQAGEILKAADQDALLKLANTRLYAIKPSGDRDGPLTGESPFLPGWPAKVGLVFAELLPIVGEGFTGSPVIGTPLCPTGGAGPKIGAMSAAGPAYIFNPTGVSCYGKDPTNGKDIALATDLSAGLPRNRDVPAIPAVGQPVFGSFAGGTSLLAPLAGVKRALDLAVPEYQPGQDLVGAWDTATGQFRPGFPTPVNDLEFIAGPAVADIDGLPGEEALAATASLDLAAFNATGTHASPAWPKLTGDWVVATPTVGTFGTLDSAPTARKVVAVVTRSGSLQVYRTSAPASAPASWPRFHHDNANSGDSRRDAVAPGSPIGVAVSDGVLRFRAPGDDGLRGTAARYEVFWSRRARIDAADLHSVGRVAELPAPARAGSTQSIRLPERVRGRVGIRAVDEQGNVGRMVVVRVRR